MRAMHRYSESPTAGCRSRSVLSKMPMLRWGTAKTQRLDPATHGVLGGRQVSTPLLASGLGRRARLWLQSAGCVGSCTAKAARIIFVYAEPPVARAAQQATSNFPAMTVVDLQPVFWLLQANRTAAFLLRQERVVFRQRDPVALLESASAVGCTTPLAIFRICRPAQTPIGVDRSAVGFPESLARFQLPLAKFRILGVALTISTRFVGHWCSLRNDREKAVKCRDKPGHDEVDALGRPPPIGG